MARMFREFREVNEQDIERLRRETAEAERRRLIREEERRQRGIELEERARQAREAERLRFEALPPEAQRMELLTKEMEDTRRNIERLQNRLQRLPEEIESKKAWKRESDERHERFMEEEEQRYGRGFNMSSRYRDLEDSHDRHMRDIDESIVKLETSISETQLGLDAALRDYRYKEMEMSELSRIAQMRKDATINQQDIPTVAQIHSNLAARQAAEEQQGLIQQRQALIDDLQKDLERMSQLQQELSANESHMVDINENLRRLNNRSQNLQTELSQAMNKLFDDFLPTIDGRRPRTIQDAIDMHSKYVAYNAHHGKAVETVEALAARALVLQCVQNGGHIAQTNATPDTPVYTGGMFGSSSKPLYAVRYGDSISFNKNDIVRDMTVQHIDSRFGMFSMEYSRTNSYGQSYQLTNTPVNLVGKPLLSEIQRIKTDFERVSKGLEEQIREQRKALDSQRWAAPRIQNQIAELQKIIDEKQAAIDSLQQVLDEKQAIIEAHQQGQLDVNLSAPEFNEFDMDIYEKQRNDEPVEIEEDYDNIILSPNEEDIEIEEDEFDYDEIAKISSDPDIEIEEDEFDYDTFVKAPSEEVAPVIEDDAVYYDMCVNNPDAELLEKIKMGLARKCLASGQEPVFVSQEDLSVMYKIERGGNWTGIESISELAHGDGLILAQSELAIDEEHFSQIANVQNISTMNTGDVVIESPSAMISTIDFSQELEQLRTQTQNVETPVIGE